MEFPVSTGIAGVSMRLKPDGLRELHWHANAAERAYVGLRLLPHDGCASGWRFSDRRFRAGRRMVLPTRVRLLDTGARL
ncbi:MAG: hypothetical protein JOZ19_02990 [Rubrobacter sp.]|nr:hypothetical protein [Rubrobacter sp.]